MATADPNRKLDQPPAHVPQNLVVDWDFHHVPGAEADTHLAWKRLHDSPEVVWTPYYGGHWIATRAEAIREVQTQHETFSHEVFSLPRTPRMLPFVPLELDPPRHTDYRRILNLAFSPKRIHALKEQINALAHELVEALVSKGHCEFVADFARHFPVTVFLRLVNLPMSERELFLAWAEAMTHGDSAQAKMQAFQSAVQYLDRFIRERRAHPGADLISEVIASRVVGDPMGEAEVVGMVTLLFFGGLDTVASMMSFIARFLATHPQHRRQLAEQPGLVPRATEEFIRRFGLSNTVRLVKHDRVFHGAPLREGELIMVPISLSSMDDRKWTHPLEIDFSRATEGHDTFGNGPHRCPGANLARLEIQTFLEAWLWRIPEFEITPGERPVTVTGAVNGVDRLPLSWAS
jgi:cytochrome P450